MEYRKKHLIHKPRFEEQLYNTLTDEEATKRFDIQSNLKKQIQSFQKKKKFECYKACTISNKGLTQYLNEKLLLLSTKLKKIKQLQFQPIVLSEDHVRKRVLEALIADFKKELRKEDRQKLENQCDQLSTGEIKSIFNKRIQKLLNQILIDSQSSMAYYNPYAINRSQLVTTDVISISNFEQVSSFQINIQTQKSKQYPTRKNTDFDAKVSNFDNNSLAVTTPIKIKQESSKFDFQKSDAKYQPKTPHNLESNQKNEFQSPQFTRPTIKQFEDVYQQKTSQNDSLHLSQDGFLKPNDMSKRFLGVNHGIKKMALAKIISLSKDEEEFERLEKLEQERLQKQLEEIKLLNEESAKLNNGRVLQKAKSLESDSMPEVQIINKNENSDNLSNNFLNSIQSDDTSPSDNKDTAFKSKNKLLLKANELAKSDIQSPMGGSMMPQFQKHINIQNSTYSKSGVGTEFRLEIINAETHTTNFNRQDTAEEKETLAAVSPSQANIQKQAGEQFVGKNNIEEKYQKLEVTLEVQKTL